MQCVAVPFSHILPSREIVRKPSNLLSPNSVKLPKVTTMSNTSFCIKSFMSINKEQGFLRDENTSTLGEKDAVIIVDHGSRRKESNLMLSEFVAMFKGRTGYRIVEPAHMELAEPSIRDAFKQCVQQGANRIIVSPFFLFLGGIGTRTSHCWQPRQPRNTRAYLILSQHHLVCTSLWWM